MSAQLIEQPNLFEAATVTAIQRRNAGMAVAFTNDLNAAYRDRLLGAIEILAIHGEPFCSDQARELAGDPPRWVHPNISGSVFNAAARCGLIRPIGFTYSTREVGNHNVVRLWVAA